MNVSMKDACFKYNKKQINNTLENICLNISSGSINVLLGLNGSGKTTLLKLLAGLEKASSGTILYDNKDLNKISIRERSRIFSYVPQHSHITSDIPVKDYLLFGTTNVLSFYEAPKKEQKVLVEQTAERMNISHLLEKNIGEISGGERQVVSIACSLIQATPIILLDEPTSALDIKNQHLVLKIMKQIANDDNKTIILSSHNPNHALFLNANVILIDKGRIKETGSADELINIIKLKEIYGDTICLSKELDYNEITFKN